MQVRFLRLPDETVKQSKVLRTMLLSRRRFLECTGATIMVAGTIASACSRSASRKGDEIIKIGLYSWSELSWMPDRIDWLGLSYARIGGVMTDQIMTFCANHSIEVLFTLTPEAPRTSFTDDDAFINAYLAQIDSALTRYGPLGTFWKENTKLHYNPIAQIEICNEPNYGYGFTGTLVEKAALYAQVLIAAYNRIKADWHSVTVVGFSAGAASATAPGFIAAAFPALQKAGGVECFDVMSVHFYSGNKAPEQLITESWGTWVAAESLDKVRQMMKQFGIDKPLWITECGYTVSQAEGGKFPDSLSDLGTPTFVASNQQAAYSIRMAMAAAREGVGRIYYMFVLDTDNFNCGWFDNGPEHDPRPVAVAMRHLNRLLRGASQLEIVSDGQSDARDNPYVYQFTTPSGPVVVAWCQTPTTFNISLDPHTETIVSDMLGTTISTLTDSKYVASLSEAPIFLYPSHAAT